MSTANQENRQADIEMLSPLNRSSEVIGELKLPKKVTLCDATIREGRRARRRASAFDRLSGNSEEYAHADHRGASP